MNDKTKIKFFRIVTITEALIIIIGLFGLSVYLDYRSGILVLPPGMKDVLSIAACFLMLCGFMFSVTGWFLWIAWLTDDKSKDNGVADNCGSDNVSDPVSDCGDHKT